MVDQLLTVNVPAVEGGDRLSDQLLMGIHTAASANGLQTADISERWRDFVRAIHPHANDEKFSALQKEFDGNDVDWINGLFTEWIALGSEKEGHHEFTRLAAIRMLASIAGPQAAYGSLVFDKLWSVIKDGSYTADARAWALFSLELCNIEVDGEIWRETFARDYSPAENGNAGFYWLEAVPEAKVRSRAIHAIGEMANNSERTTCWNSSGLESCRKNVVGCRLQNDDRLFEEAENLLLVHSNREIDYSVITRLVEALGRVAGWAGLPKGAQNSWRVIEILRDASDSPEDDTRNRVASSIERIASNIMRRQGILPVQRKGALEQLVELAVNRVKLLARDRDGGRQRAYEEQRCYLLALRGIAQSAQEDANSSEKAEFISLAVGGLLDVADGFPSDETEPGVRERYLDAVKLRRLALRYVGHIVESDFARQVVIEKSTERCKQMLADPKLIIARDAAFTLVRVMGEAEAAAYFVQVIMNDEGLDEAIAFRNRYGRSDSDNNHLKHVIRTLLAEVLGGIGDNSAAHDELVRTLRSDALHGSRARDALITMGGERAVESIIQFNLQQQVNDKFFQPMEEASKNGYALLGDVRRWSGTNYKFAYYVSMGLFALGALTFIAGLFVSLFVDKDILSVEFVAGSALTSSLGFLGTIIWQPVKGMNKVVSELSRLIMSFENYLGRMRLIGLGFAHAYTQNSFDQLQFLSRVSEITAKAMRESSMMMESIGAHPDFEVQSNLAAAPALIDQPLVNARRLAEESKMDLDVGKRVYMRGMNADIVVAQDPGPGVFVTRDTRIRVTLSTNQPPAVEVPDFTGNAIPQAWALAQERDLVIEQLVLSFSDEVEEGSVIGQDLRVGLNVTAGTGVGLVIAKQAETTNKTED